MAKTLIAPTSMADLKPAPYNPRKISPKAASALQRSLGEFGDLSGITWNSRTGHVVAGHQRLAELRKMGANLVDGCVVATGERYQVRVVDWPEGKEKAANVVANSPSIAGEFTDGLQDVLVDVGAELDHELFADLLLSDLEEEEREGATELKEWDASDVSADGLFIFHAPIELQGKVRAVLEREFPGVSFDEEIVFG